MVRLCKLSYIYGPHKHFSGLISSACAAPVARNSAATLVSRNFFMASFRTFAFIDPIEPEHAIILPSRQIFATIDIVIVARGHPDALEVHHGMVATRYDIDTATITVNRAA